MPSDKTPTTKAGLTQSNLPNAESSSDVNLMAQKTTEPASLGYTQERVNKLVARSLEWNYKDLLNTIFAFSLPSIEKVDPATECLKILVHFPFFLPDPIAGETKWTDSKTAQNRLRNDFIKYLRGKDFGRKLATFLQTQFAYFLLDFSNANRYPKSIGSYLQKIPQKITAGRHGEVFDPKIASRISIDGPRVYKFVVNLQANVQRWIKRDPELDEAGVRNRIFRSFPPKKYPWTEPFMRLANHVPRKPYSLARELRGQSDGGLPRATLATPRLWSRFDIAVKILCYELLRKHKAMVSARTVRNLLRKSLGNN